MDDSELSERSCHAALKEKAAVCVSECAFHQKELPVLEFVYEAMLIVAISRGSER